VSGRVKGKMQKTYYNGGPRAAFIISRTFTMGRYMGACRAWVGHGAGWE